MARAARQTDPWGRGSLDDWLIIEDPDRFKVALPRTPQTIRQNFRLIDRSPDRRIESANVPTEAVQFAYMILDQADDKASENGRFSLILEWCAEINRWDRYDFAAVIGIIIACLGFVTALFPSVRTLGIFFPIGAALMAFAAYGASRKDTSDAHGK
jgi:hypothetical protein